MTKVVMQVYSRNGLQIGVATVSDGAEKQIEITVAESVADSIIEFAKFDMLKGLRLDIETIPALG